MKYDTSSIDSTDSFSCLYGRCCHVTAGSEMLLAQGWQKSKILQKKSESWVSAKAQAYFLIQLKERAFFSEEEYAIVLRGRNTHSASKAKNADVTTYRMSTGLEALFGWLYLTHQEDRLKALWEEIQKIGEYQ